MTKKPATPEEVITAIEAADAAVGKMHSLAQALGFMAEASTALNDPEFPASVALLAELQIEAAAAHDKAMQVVRNWAPDRFVARALEATP
ncbi:hypothetical protein [Acidocella sp.]|uniref:hypothetical protein n=1 Tax=Acidocella sp. TaxID=50710 RepID=UPI00261816D2|nr:hypothetical protein [Acidocella sp.]